MCDCVPVINANFKSSCDAELSLLELKDCLKSMKNGKSPDIDEIFSLLNFWNILEQLVLDLYKKCLKEEEFVTTMKQCVISLITKPGKDPFWIDDWHPISLLTTEYKRLKSPN